MNNLKSPLYLASIYHQYLEEIAQKENQDDNEGDNVEENTPPAPEPEFKGGDKVVVVVKESGYIYTGLYTFEGETDSSFVLIDPYSENAKPSCHPKNGENAVRLEKFTPEKKKEKKTEEESPEPLKGGDKVVIFDKELQTFRPKVHSFKPYSHILFPSGRYTIFKCPMNYDPNTGGFS